MKKAIVLGATGLVGSKLIEHLAKEPTIEKVVAVTRRPVAYESEKIINAVVDFDGLEKHRDLFNGDVLFSCLGTTLKQAGSIAAQRVVDFDYQYIVAKMAADNQVNHYLLVSSSGANANSKSPYLKMKGELEDAISSLPFKRISILQPSLLIGERESFRLAETVGSWVLPVVCKLPGLKKYRPISGDQVAEKMVTLGLSAGQSREVYRLDEVFK
ncbi:NAD-dependent epimerase/dehydratase family protein [Marinicella sp. S1101]|uniref:NAD(P)H-binding protein n=1 Tax=Marinicella marina TaxID=2996016 RepID=UPI002260F5F3|nr:NAD(P)H-binding protein [Marinicella marina]MCX7552249.1 NAD-dependent epimerase/dehydratase family protein [Marinicella marina]MDJ1139125.1 NAD-dependent epimerase/dehydratase family protein [Marinicella marina]